MNAHIAHLGRLHTHQHNAPCQLCRSCGGCRRHQVQSGRRKGRRAIRGRKIGGGGVLVEREGGRMGRGEQRGKMGEEGQEGWVHGGGGGKGGGGGAT